MKFLLLLPVCTALVLAAGDGCTVTNTDSTPNGTDSNDITLTLVNDWTLPLGILAYGLDVLEDAVVYILATDYINMSIQFYTLDGLQAATVPLSPANTGCFGVAWNNGIDTGTYYTNDWSQDVLYYTEDFGTGWTTVNSPAGTSTGGMAFDGTDYWAIGGVAGGIWRFQPGVSAENIAIPEVTAEPSGVAVFPYNGNLGVAVTTYIVHKIYFYEWDGYTMNFIGSAPCPVLAIGASFGLAYSNESGTMFWSYADNDTVWHIAEFSFSLAALEPSSWGSIKSSF